MKITKSYLKQIIKEELEKIEEVDTTTQNVPQASPQETKEQLIGKVNSLDAQVKAAEAAVKNLPNLKKQLQDARDQLGKL